jgi:hypothetical protein
VVKETSDEVDKVVELWVKIRRKLVLGGEFTPQLLQHGRLRYEPDTCGYAVVFPECTELTVGQRQALERELTEGLAESRN